MKPKKVVFYLLTCLVLLAFSSISSAAIPVKVSIDKGTIITLKEPAKRVSLANPNIADLNLISPYEILLNGKTLGSTNLIVWDTKGKATFFDVIVMGDISTLEEQIGEIVPGTDVTVETAGDVIILRGSIENDQTRTRIEALSKAFAPAKDKVINLIEITEAQQVLLEVRVAQVNRSKLKEMSLGALVVDENFELLKPGIFSPEGIVGTGTGAFGFDIGDIIPELAAVHFPSGVGAVLRALSSKGYAKILAEPNLVVRSGEEGNFHVGTRFPIQVVEDEDVSIQFEEIGIRLNFKPEVLATGVIRLNIDPAEVSNIQDFVRFQNLIAPVIDTRTVRTSVDLQPGESLILAGLLDDQTKKNIQKIPFLGDIPIFGAIFRSTSDELTQTEIAFFITPKLIKPIPGGETVELPGEKPLTPKEENEFRWIPVPEEHEY
jgi:pilus assembly protein CpaC